MRDWAGFTQEICGGAHNPALPLPKPVPECARYELGKISPEYELAAFQHPVCQIQTVDQVRTERHPKLNLVMDKEMNAILLAYLLSKQKGLM